MQGSKPYYIILVAGNTHTTSLIPEEGTGDTIPLWHSGQAECLIYRIVRCPFSEGLFLCESMEMVFRTEESTHIIVDGHISGVSARWGSTVSPYMHILYALSV